MNAVKKFHARGFLGPITIADQQEITYYNQCVVNAEQQINLAHSDYRYKSNVLFPWVDQLSRHPKIVSAVSELIGPNFTCPDAIFWIKRPGEGRDVSWHQDATYWNLSDPDQCCVVWYAFNDVPADRGPLRYIPGTHLKQRRHNDIKSTSNLLMRGQTVDYPVEDYVEQTAQAGQILIHHPQVIHGSAVNNSTESRLAVSFIYASTACKPRISHSPESTVLISGQDTYNYMLLDARPREPWTENLPQWRSAYDRQHDNYFKLSQQPMGI